MEEKDKILRLILGIEVANDRKSTLQLALRKARKIIDITQGERVDCTKFNSRKSKVEGIVDSDSENLEDGEDEMDLLTALSLYLIVLDQLGHIFGGRSKNSNRIEDAIKLSETTIIFDKEELSVIANLRNSINHNFGLACYSPSQDAGVIKYVLCFDDAGNERPIVKPEDKWMGNWCDKDEKTSAHIFPFSLMNFVEDVLKSYIEKINNNSVKSPLCVEELKTRFTIIT